MPKLDANEVLTAMLSAAEQAAKKRWPKVKSYCEPELKKIGAAIVSIEERRALGLISDNAARLELKICRSATEVVLEGLKGEAKLAAEAAINAALDAVREMVNRALGFALL